ncbi:UPF0598 protein CG30010 [Periplaneta americana]|uniref:UPF0598 protein CG30010 n=1 Tax=Periplaneta americana TaxID=6978 RepID=UPI0037E74F97
MINQIINSQGKRYFQMCSRYLWNKVAYEQGQSPEPSIREYFYYIDHQGMLFLDDARMKNFTSCFKDKKFLEFFFKRLKVNTTGRYMQDFPYLSLCGRERNFIRCDDYPIVYTHVIKTSVNGQTEDHLSYGYAGNLLSVKFEPEKVFMLPDTGRVYHPASEKVGGVGLVRSKLAIEFSRLFRFDEGEHNSPTHFTWDGKTFELERKWYYEAVQKAHNS